MPLIVALLLLITSSAFAQDLPALQLRTSTLWQEHDAHSTRRASWLLAASTLSTVVFGAVGSASAARLAHLVDSDPWYGSDPKYERRLSATTLALAGLGVAAIAWSSYELRQARRARSGIERELSAIAQRRSELLPNGSEELLGVQSRESELWSERDGYCVNCGVVAATVGSSLALVGLSSGGFMVALAHSLADDQSQNAGIAKAGASLLLLAGVAGLFITGWGVDKIVTERRPRNAQLRELRAIAPRRAALENRVVP
jgi:hypothetical protein